MIVWVYRVFGVDYVIKDFDCVVGDDFVGVYVGLGVRVGLLDYQWKVVVKFVFENFICGLNDSICDFCVQFV